MNLTLKRFFCSGLIALSVAACTSDFEVGEAAVKSKDYKTAFAKLAKPAEAGNAVAQLYMGMMYSEGEGVSRDDQKAFFWYAKSAEQGNANAQFNLGNMYLAGKGTAQDDKQAAYWFTKSAEQGILMAQDNLGLLYVYGKGVARDDNQAIYWFSKAAERGYEKAQYNLGQMFWFGKGVQQDDKQAFYWFAKAAEQGNAVAQNNLGFMYGNGRGVDPNLSLSYMWFALASANGYPNASRGLDGAASQMTQIEVERANQMAKECRDQAYKNCDKLGGNNSAQAEAPKVGPSDLLKIALSLSEQNPRMVNEYIASLGSDGVAMCAALGAKTSSFIILNPDQFADKNGSELVKILTLNHAVSTLALASLKRQGIPVDYIYKDNVQMFAQSDMKKILEVPWKKCNAALRSALTALPSGQFPKYMNLNFRP